MKIEYVPLLQIQRHLQGLPRSFERFQEYLNTIRAPDGSGLKLPSLVAMNPMGKEHVTALLNALIALDADALATRAVEEASQGLADVPGDFKATLVIADDLKGGWTNRYANEYTHRFPGGSPPGHESRPPKWTEFFGSPPSTGAVNLLTRGLCGKRSAPPSTARPTS